MTDKRKYVDGTFRVRKVYIEERSVNIELTKQETLKLIAFLATSLADGVPIATVSIVSPKALGSGAEDLPATVSGYPQPISPAA
jgi:hypothetical protein